MNNFVEAVLSCSTPCKSGSPYKVNPHLRVESCVGGSAKAVPYLEITVAWHQRTPNQSIECGAQAERRFQRPSRDIIFMCVHSMPYDPRATLRQRPGCRLPELIPDVYDMSRYCSDSLNNGYSLTTLGKHQPSESHKGDNDGDHDTWVPTTRHCRTFHKVQKNVHDVYHMCSRSFFTTMSTVGSSPYLAASFEVIREEKTKTVGHRPSSMMENTTG